MSKSTRNKAYCTASPASLSAFAVPPDAINVRPILESCVANSVPLVLSETLRIARFEKRKMKFEMINTCNEKEYYN